MKHRTITYSNESCFKVINIEIFADDELKISYQAINKALMIAMNYLIETWKETKRKAPNKALSFISS